MSAQLMAIVTEGKNGRNYHAPTQEHAQVADVPIPDNAPDTDLPEKALSFRVQVYGMVKHRDLFTPRQLVALTTFSDLVAEAREQIHADALAVGLPNDPTPLRDGGTAVHAYAEAISVYLAFAVDRLAEKSNSLSSWQNTADKVRGVFARQAIPMIWDYADVNAFSSSTGNFYDNVEWVAKVIDFLSPCAGSHSVDQADATNFLDINRSFVYSTDPPYYDNIGYADLSDFFYTWLRHSLRTIYPNIFSTVLTPKRSELIASPYRFDGNKDKANSHFEHGLQQVFSLIQAKALPDYPVSVFYAFKQSEIEHTESNQQIEQAVSSTGWETMLTSLIEAGFVIKATWPMRTERTGRTLSIGTNALASSIVLVCRPRPENAPITSRRDFVNTLRQELPAALREMLSGNIAPVDLAQASIGPGMAVYSRYQKVLEPNGDRLTVRAALQLINQVLDEYLAETEGDLDADSRFAVSWFEQSGFNAGAFGTADVLARAKNTSVDGLVNAGVITSGAGKVRLLTWEEMDPGWDPATDKRATVWEATHHLIERLNVHGEEGAALLLAKMSPELAADARQLAYRLYAICERKGWADHARDYNALVISWSNSAERAAVVKQSYQPKLL
jgi:putative DNA methylase